MSLPYLLFHVLTYRQSHREPNKLRLLLTVASSFTACAGHACVCDRDRHGRRRETERVGQTDRQTGWREGERGGGSLATHRDRLTPFSGDTFQGTRHVESGCAA